jgi:hypothetical protein
MTRFTLVQVFLCGLTLAPAVTAQNPSLCSTAVLSVRDAAKVARRSPGKMACVRGVLSEVSNRTGRFSFPVLAANDRTAATDILLIDWSPDFAQAEKYYEPDTFNLLADRSTENVSATVFGMLFYKRNLIARARRAAGHAVASEALDGIQRDVELVLLKVLSVDAPGTAR